MWGTKNNVLIETLQTIYGMDNGTTCYNALCQLLKERQNQDEEQTMNPNKISFDVFERFPFKIQQFRIDQEGALESAAFKEFIKRYWIFQTHAEKTQYNPIDVKSRVEQTLKNNELSFTIHKVKDNEVKHIFQSSTIQAVPTNQHQFFYRTLDQPHT